MSVYGLFKFFFSRQYIPVWYTPTKHELRVYDSAGRKTTKFSTVIKINWTSLFLQKSDWRTDKCMPKVIYDHAENVKVYINLASSFSWNHCFECKLTVEVFSFDMLPAWVIH